MLTVSLHPVILPALVLLSLFQCAGGTTSAAPAVTNISASQRPGTKLVDISFDLAAPGFAAVTTALEVSDDGGASFDVPAVSLTGAIGPGTTTGTGKMITWDAGADWDGQYNTQMQFRISASDEVPEGMSVIPGGNFTMGRISSDSDTNSPTITVAVSTFYIAHTETTGAQWNLVAAWGLANGYTDFGNVTAKAADHPVRSVTWLDAVKWCNARSQMEGLTPCYKVGGNIMKTGTTVPTVDWTANGYRLPTEAEWEKAARGGTNGRRFPWALNSISHADANFLNDGGEAYQSGTTGYHPDWNQGGTPYTSPVGSFAPNGFGLTDMAGNVWEWCWDRYSSTYYSTSDGTSNPTGPSSGTDRVLRGGSWRSEAANSRCSIRLARGIQDTLNSYGFRVVRGQLIDRYKTIPGGSFTMGRTSGDSDSNAPPVTVTVNTFYMAETETTKARWDLVRTWGLANGYTDLAAGAGKGSSHPVQTVTWHDVVKWCNAHSEMDGLTPVYTIGGEVMRTGTGEPEVDMSANGYRLPTEAEWEKAARGGVSGKRFPWGTDTISHSEANFYDNTYVPIGESGYRIGYHPDYKSGGWPYTSPVGSFPANGYGLKDVSGNVAEWCWDWYDSDYYSVAEDATDPAGPLSGTGRISRGGSWSEGSSAFRARCSTRISPFPSTASYSYGFRSARSSVP